MRTNKEISRAAALLRRKGDRTSLIQAEVIETRLTEKAVFELYVTNVPAEEKDEAAFFAARDAARYVAGSITLEELVPDVDITSRQTESDTPGLEILDEDRIVVSKRMLYNLLSRVNRLELKVGIRKTTMKVNRKKATGNEPEDLISQAEVVRLLGCGKSTVKRWADRGYITGYQKDGHVYYSKKEIRNSQVFKEYLIASGKDKKVKL